MRLPSTICLGPHGYREPLKSTHVGDGPGFVQDDVYRRAARALRGGSGASIGGR